MAVLIAVMALSFAPQAAADDPVPTATVLRVVDGDTVDVRDDVRGRLRIRVLGIDTPETKKPEFTVGCWGPEATLYATSQLVGQRVALVADPSQDATDRYGRTLVYLVKDGGWNYSIEAARAGAAKSYVYKRNPVSLQPQIAAAQEEAVRAQRGLWGPPCFGNTGSQPG